MEVSLDQAIDTHARVLKYWYGDKAPQEARARALECGTLGDFEGLQAWARVARLCEALGAVEPPALIFEAEELPNWSAFTEARRPLSKAPEPWRPIRRE